MYKGHINIFPILFNAVLGLVKCGYEIEKLFLCVMLSMIYCIKCILQIKLYNMQLLHIHLTFCRVMMLTIDCDILQSMGSFIGPPNSPQEIQSKENDGLKHNTATAAQVYICDLI